MDWIQERFSTIGGAGGGIIAYLMNISIIHTVEIGLYALVGGLIGEGVKEISAFIKRKIKK